MVRYHIVMVTYWRKKNLEFRCRPLTCCGRSCWRPPWTPGSDPGWTWRTHCWWRAGPSSWLCLGGWRSCGMTFWYFFFCKRENKLQMVLNLSSICDMSKYLSSGQMHHYIDRLFGTKWNCLSLQNCIQNSFQFKVNCLRYSLKVFSDPVLQILGLDSNRLRQ